MIEFLERLASADPEIQYAYWSERHWRELRDAAYGEPFDAESSWREFKGRLDQIRSKAASGAIAADAEPA